MCAAALVTTATSSSAAPAARLVYAREDGADECPDISAFRKAVSARVGYDPFFPFAEITVTADIRRAAHRLTGRVVLVDEHGIIRGSREMAVAEGECAELVSSMALAVSIALDSLTIPERTSAQPSAPPPEDPPPDRPSPPASTAAPVTAEKPASPPPRASATRTRARPLVGVSALGAAGSAPSATAGLALTGGLQWRFVSGEVEARADLPASTDGPAGGGIRARLLSLSALPCLHGALVYACATLAVDMIRAHGIDVASPREASAVFLAAGGRIGIEKSLTSAVFARGYVDLVVPFSRPTLRVAGADVWSPSIPSGAVGLGIFLKIP